MLDILRKNAQSIVIQVIVVVIAVVFVFWGVGTNLGGNPNALAVVNGKEIGYREFQESYERAVESYKQQFGGQLPQEFIESIGLKQQVLNQLIQSELLRQGAEKSACRCPLRLCSGRSRRWPRSRRMAGSVSTATRWCSITTACRRRFSKRASKTICLSVGRWRWSAGSPRSPTRRCATGWSMPIRR